jgi:hypothetical protein
MTVYLKRAFSAIMIKKNNRTHKVGERTEEDGKERRS